MKVPISTQNTKKIPNQSMSMPIVLNTGSMKGTVSTCIVMASMNIPITRRMALRMRRNSRIPKSASTSMAATIWGSPKKFSTLEKIDPPTINAMMNTATTVASRVPA